MPQSRFEPTTYRLISEPIGLLVISVHSSQILWVYYHMAWPGLISCVKKGFAVLHRNEKKGIYKNLLLICLSFMLNFTAFCGIGNLQSSLNDKGNLGVTSLATIYASLIISAIFTPTYGKSLQVLYYLFIFYFIFL